MRPYSLLIALVAAATAAAEPVQIATSGYLLDAADQPVDAAAQAMTFRLHSHATASAPVWESAACSVRVARGYYAVTLGQECNGAPALDASHLPAGEGRYLEVLVGSVALAPRQALHAAPTAARALDAARLGGITAARYARLDTPAAFSADVSVTGGAQFSGKGTGLTQLSAASLTVGTIADAQLASAADLAKLSGAQTFTGAKTFAAGLASSADVTVTGAGRFVGDGSGLTNLPVSGGAAGQLTWSPGTLAFGNVMTTSSTQSATLTNTGATAVSGLVVTATAGYSLQSTTCGTSLAAGANCTASFRFTPGVPAGARNGAGIAFSNAGSPAVLLTGTSVPGDGITAASAGTTCATIKTAFPASIDGSYYIDPDGPDAGSAAFLAHCDMTTNNVGWTLCLSNAPRGKGTRIIDQNEWWTTTWDKGTRVFTRGHKSSGTAWGNFCPLLASQSTQIYATVHSETNALTKGDICTLDNRFWTPNSGYLPLNCAGTTRMAAIPKNNYSANGCTGCIFWSDEITTNTTATIWGHAYYGTHVIVKLGGASAYGPSGVHWGYVNTGMTDPANGGDVHCGSGNAWCYEAFTSSSACGGSCDKWLKSMQLYVR